jgi:nitrate/nitrite transport system ATP-binding protein
MPHQKFLELIKVGKTFRSGGKPPAEILAGVDLHLAKGEFVAVIGHSGCGKSTLLSMLAGLETITAGSICFKEHEITGPGPERAVVFQQHSLLPWRTVLGNVRLAVDAVFARESKAQRQTRAERWIEKVGLKDHMHKYPHEISGGMKQRAGIARALSMEPEVLLLDEPFGALDALTRAQLQDEVLRLHAENGLTVFMVTHDIDEAVYCSDRIVMMNVGPRAHIGQIIDVPFARPRERISLMESDEFAHIRARCVRFLYDQKGHRAPAAAPAPIVAPAVAPTSVGTDGGLQPAVGQCG